MATTTEKLNLTKPENNDYVDVTVLSENFQKLDDAYGGFTGDDDKKYRFGADGTGIYIEEV